MQILINDKPADITLETEKTLGDVISGIEKWVSSSGNRMQKICVNGEHIPIETLNETFPIEINEIKKLDIFICPWRELAAEALGDLYETSLFYENSAFDERKQILSDWGKSSAARFLNSDIPDIYNLALLALSGEGISPAQLNTFLEERLREITDPQAELNNSEELVEVTIKRMEELPLDIQTGKDHRASETVQLFAQIGEKLFRIYFIFKSEGLFPETFVIDDLSPRSFIEEFNAALKELSSAYENHDTVLVGDIAEYELAPRLVKFFTALKNALKSGS